jgi:chaperone modulatory protein CbpM
MKKAITFSFHEVSQEYSISEDHLEQFIIEEWITPYDEEEMLFDEEDIARMNLICELRDDLGVNDESIPIILKLLDQLHHVRGMVKKINSK